MADHFVVGELVELREHGDPSITAFFQPLCFHNPYVLELGAGAAQKIFDLHVQGACRARIQCCPETRNP